MERNLDPQAPVVAHDEALLADEHPVDMGQLQKLYGLFREAVAVGGPEFGTEAWLALERDDPQREAALVRQAFSWTAAELGVGAPASREHLERVVREEVSRELSEASSEVSALYSDPKSWRQAQREYDERQLG